MPIINRAVAVIKPKQPFVDWANGLPDAEIQVPLEDFHADCLTILIPLYNAEKDGKALVEEHGGTRGADRRCAATTPSPGRAADRKPRVC